MLDDWKNQCQRALSAPDGLTGVICQASHNMEYIQPMNLSKSLRFNVVLNNSSHMTKMKAQVYVPIECVYFSQGPTHPTKGLLRPKTPDLTPHPIILYSRHRIKLSGFLALTSLSPKEAATRAIFDVFGMIRPRFSPIAIPKRSLNGTV